ncbi:MAG: 8-amino-7-oxononanoate synthase [Gammaproteobacteria bacterium]|nr:8-amino-7-oxononanoate synthase [Gammaproteobacteria bacterium]MBU1654189.1 8-amino-7-oxononanoate synthase [Gammaproteobacteria bacterium]MBU1959663.1 8-amino-7-oxononanoate synthase [Gammaproteobacteria bacterium]
MPQDLKAGLERRRAEHLYRHRRVLGSPQGREIILDGQKLLSFCSNDYLGLSRHPKVIEAFRQGAENHGVGSGAAHLITGHGTAHQKLEEVLAEFVGYPRALLFSTGYMANLGVISALLGRADCLFADRLNHASLIDGGLLSRARLKRYPHGNVASLLRQLASVESGKKLVATDGVFSMDGDLAPLPQLAQTCANQDAWLMVDDAHGIGVIGPEGRGTLAHFGLGPSEVPILMGTLGKALGAFGAFVAGSEELIETLIQQARPYIYTTAPPPAVAEAVRAGIELVITDQWRRDRLVALVQRFRTGAERLGLKLFPSHTPIQPLLLGESERALAWSRELEALGILATAIRPPTVPAGSARLRITFSAEHLESDVDSLLVALESIMQREAA